MRNMNWLLRLMSCLMVVGATAQGQSSRDGGSRQVTLFNDHWTYLEQESTDPTLVGTTTTGWTAVTLPHTWNLTDAVDQVPGYRRSAGWYRKEFQAPPQAPESRWHLYFEGVNIVSDVYVNGVRAGGHVGGYVGFTVDITPFVKPGAPNVLLVRASNAYDPNVIPSQKSDFHIYGGITRDVWLISVPSVHLASVRVATPSVSRESASTVATVEVRNDRTSGSACDVEAVLKDGRGKVVARASERLSAARGVSAATLKFPVVRSPKLWSPADPALYAVEVTLKEGGRTIDRQVERIGYRWFEFKEHGPFFLNGERLLLRGTHRHEDYAGYANAMPDSLHRKDMMMIKEMGANFVRLAHYPQDPEVYRACDELGILVWDELPWCRGGMGGDEWKANTRRLLKEQILQTFNHPSIIIRSLGNELYWLPDFPNGDHLDSLRSMIASLNTIAHELDPGRVTATRKFTEGDDLVDVVSPSIWPGWYSGSYNAFEKAIADSHRSYKRFFHAEYGGDSHVGRHSESPVSGAGVAGSEGWEEDIKPQKIKNVALASDWNENYIVNLFDWYLHIIETTDWLSGNAQWAFKDFPTPLRPENPIPYINQKGLVDRAGKPKDAYYVFKSYWTTSPEFCYIESHTWTERSGPAGLKREVKVFSNCPEVELSLNGTSLGKRVRAIRDFPASGLRWPVEFVDGRNTIVATGLRDGRRVAIDSLTLVYRFQKNGNADHIELTSRRLPNGTVLVTATAVDKNGRRCLDYGKRIYFAHDGGGRLLENEGTPTRSSVIEMANGAATIEFQPEAGRRAVIEARNQDFKGAYLVLE